MQHEITKKCADSLRSFAQNKYNIQLKSSHAHELVAAYFGYSSRAALLADAKCPISNLKEAEFLVLTPTAPIKERRKELNGLTEELPDDLSEGVYLPLIDEKWIVCKIWPTLEYLGVALADQNWKVNPANFKGMEVQRHGVKLEFHNDEVAIVVFREYVFPGLTLGYGKNVSRGVVDVFNLKRVAGFIGYAKTNHYSAEAEALDAAIIKMRDAYHGLISSPQFSDVVAPLTKPELNFTDWLKKQKNRDSPTGDLAQHVMDDKTWPTYNSLESYRNYLFSRNASPNAVHALESAWKAYKASLKRKNAPKTVEKFIRKPTIKEEDSRIIVFVKNVTPLHYNKRTVENFNSEDKAWISWDGKKAIPVTVLKSDDRQYSVRIERPRKKAGNIHSLFLDEVRSTPLLACLNHVTL